MFLAKNPNSNYDHTYLKKPGAVYTPVIPALRRLRPGDWEFEVCMGYIARSCLKKKKERKKKKNKIEN
jgi:hypothetical protein